MKKYIHQIIGIIFIILMFCSCSREDKEVISNYEVAYGMDKTTHLCFAFIKNGEVDAKTMTCVPCDSLENVTVHYLISTPIDNDKIEKRLYKTLMSPIPK